MSLHSSPVTRREYIGRALGGIAYERDRRLEFSARGGGALFGTANLRCVPRYFANGDRPAACSSH